ncbi:pectate lyase [Algibacter agarivorans]|uniref:Pectate lyase n=1 Tax=Algibacter agarivorans TaxID=1109741 RepID=A0ABP9GCH1_9FLAO
MIEESTIIAEEPEEEIPNTEDEVIPIDTVDDTVITMQHLPVDIEAYLNDINLPESIILSNTNPSNGVLTINNNDTPDNFLDDTVVYTPNAGFSGNDSFDYTVCDATNSENCDTATVSITIDSIEENIATELKAFPSAFGAGAYVTGGRGGQVIHVTNLSDNGPGSLREAIETKGSRIIVFDVSGEINLQSRIILGSGYGDVTIAGQTAPDGGITITGGRLWWNRGSDNIIVRNIRFRNGKDSDNGDCITIEAASNVIVDHCSFAWAKDEALDISGNGDDGNITIQNCLFFENKTAMIVGTNDSAPYGSVSILRNASSNTSHRFPKGAGDMELDVINNLIHNWRYRTLRLDGFDFTLNHIGNYYQSGSNTLASALNYDSSTGKLVTGIYMIATNTTMSPNIYSRFNHIDRNLIDLYNNEYSTNPDGSYDMSAYSETNDISAWHSFGSTNTNPVKSEWFTSIQQTLQGLAPNILAASSLKTEILPTVGACQTLNADGTLNFWRDSIDIQAVDEIQNDNSRPLYLQSDSKFGANPTYTSVTRPEGYDTDADGMADIWERAKFGDLSKDGKGDTDGDGYNDLEEFLNSVDN